MAVRVNGGDSLPRQPKKVPTDHEFQPNDKFPPGMEITRFPGSLSNYQGYPKSGSMGITFLVAFEDIEAAWPITKLTGLEFDVILRRPEKQITAEEQWERAEKGLDTDWDDLARRFD